MPKTASSHFAQDIQRARSIVAHAGPLPRGTPAESMLRSDLFRGAWMLAVGALDAYFCDAYTDVVAAAIIAKTRRPSLALPEFFYDIKFPVRAILERYPNNTNWRWRMAARKLMERENVLRLETVQTLFNKFFRKGHRFFRDVVPGWIVHSPSRRHLFGVSAGRFAALPAATATRRSRPPSSKWRIAFERFSNADTIASTTAIALGSRLSECTTSTM